MNISFLCYITRICNIYRLFFLICDKLLVKIRMVSFGVFILSVYAILICSMLLADIFSICLFVSANIIAIIAININDIKITGR